MSASPIERSFDALTRDAFAIVVSYEGRNTKAETRERCVGVRGDPGTFARIDTSARYHVVRGSFEGTSSLVTDEFIYINIDEVFDNQVYVHLRDLRD